MLQQMPYLEEESVSLLLERGLIVKDDKLEFSRDKRLKNYVSEVLKNEFFILALVYYVYYTDAHVRYNGYF